MGRVFLQSRLKQCRNRGRAAGRLTMLGLILAAVCIFTMMCGRYFISLRDLSAVLTGQTAELAPKHVENIRTIVLNIRLPRLLVGIAVGGALAASGSVYQGLFRNPIVSPDVLGASSGAAFGAALGILLECRYTGINLMAFGGGLIAVLLAYGLSRRHKTDSVTGLILAGMMIGSLFSAGTSLMKLIADPTSKLPAITYWLMGSLASAKIQDVRLMVVPLLLGFIPLLVCAWFLNALSFGDDVARSLGVNINRLKAVVIACATLLTAVSVAVSGMIGWIGLVVPHLSRKIVGSDYKVMLPASMLIGPTFILLVDDIARTAATVEIPIGILMSFVGIPFFLYLLMGSRRLSG